MLTTINRMIRGKTLLFHSKSIFHSELSLIWPYPLEKPKAHMIHLRHAWPPLTKSMTYKISFLRYWWSNIPAIWLYGRLFLPINLNFIIKLKEKVLLFCEKLINISLWTIFNLVIYPRPIKSTLAGIRVFGRNWGYLDTFKQK